MVLFASTTTVLLVGETLLLVLLAALVAGLLRSHAEILRRLGPAEDDPRRTQAANLPAPPQRAEAAPARDIAGATLDAEAVQVGLAPGGRSTLLAFLSSGCLTCEGFWDAFQSARRPEIPGGARLVIVTKDTTHESPSRLRELAPADIGIVMSSAAWEDYGVPTSPYFVYVDGPSGTIMGEGAASAWPQVESLLRDALADLELAAERGTAATGRPGSGAERISRADRELDAAGIGPGHPSLYPEAGAKGTTPGTRGAR
jgi:hypothetical protein